MAKQRVYITASRYFSLSESQTISKYFISK